MLVFIGIFITALATGVFFFAGLHYSIGKFMVSSYAAFWAVGSFLLRSGITLGVFYWLSAGSAVRLVVCAAAFIVAKVLVIRLMGRSEERDHLKVAGGEKGGQHATES